MTYFLLVAIYLRMFVVAFVVAFMAGVVDYEIAGSKLNQLGGRRKRKYL